MYDKSTILSSIKEYNQLKRVSVRNSASLSRYKHYTIDQFIYEYNTNGLKGRKVYDELMAAIAQEELLPQPPKAPVEKPKPERYSQEDLLSLKKKELPYVSNVHQSIGKLMDAIINQAILVLENHSSTNVKYSKVLRYFFIEHKSYDEIAQITNDTRWNIQGNVLIKFMKGEQLSSDISIADSFKTQVTSLADPMLYKVCNAAFEENDIDTPEKIKFFAYLSGYVIHDNIKEWGDVLVLTKDSSKNNTRQHLISLKKAICEAIVPIPLSDLVERTKADFLTKNEASEFDPQIIENFVQSHPWIQTDDDDNYYILTKYLDATYQRQGRIIYEAGEPIHHLRVKAIYKSIYGEDYKSHGIQYLLRNRAEHDFFPYGRSGLWYYSENGTEIQPANKVIANFVDEHISFNWKDLADIGSQLHKINKKFDKRRIRMEVTSLCYVDNNDKDHFVKKGEEANYPSFSWQRSKQNRTNWCVNHAYEILKDTPNGEMRWSEFESLFKQDLIDTGRPLRVLEDIKYKHSGSVSDRRVFIRENDTIRINEDVVESEYNGDLSMYGLYRKCPQYYSVIFSLAMTELRKQEDGKMLLVDFIALVLKNIEIDDEDKAKIDASYIRRLFEDNGSLPEGLSRYNDNGSVYLKYDVIEENDTESETQYVVTAQPSDYVQSAPQLKVAEERREPVTYATRFDWVAVKKALKADLAFYDSPFWYEGITSDNVLDKFIVLLSSSNNYNLNTLVPQIIYEFHYARIDRYDLNQYMRNLSVAFEALLRELYESAHRPIKTHGIKDLCENGFTDYDNALTNHERKGFGGILNDLVYKRNLLLHGANLELSPVTLVRNIVEYIALFVYTVSKYSLAV